MCDCLHPLSHPFSGGYESRKRWCRWCGSRRDADCGKPEAHAGGAETGCRPWLGVIAVCVGSDNRASVHGVGVGSVACLASASTGSTGCSSSCRAALASCVKYVTLCYYTAGRNTPRRMPWHHTKSPAFVTPASARRQVARPWDSALVAVRSRKPRAVGFSGRRAAGAAALTCALPAPRTSGLMCARVRVFAARLCP